MKFNILHEDELDPFSGALEHEDEFAYNQLSLNAKQSWVRFIPQRVGMRTPDESYKFSDDFIIDTWTIGQETELGVLTGVPYDPPIYSSDDEGMVNYDHTEGVMQALNVVADDIGLPWRVVPYEGGSFGDFSDAEAANMGFKEEDFQARHPWMMIVRTTPTGERI